MSSIDPVLELVFSNLYLFRVILFQWWPCRITGSQLAGARLFRVWL